MRRFAVLREASLREEDVWTYRVQIDIIDDTGNMTSVENLISVQAMRVFDDPLHPGQQVILVGGTQNRDRINFSTRSGGCQLVVPVNGRTAGTYVTEQFSRVVAYGGDLLIGGTTNDDNDAAALALLMTEWRTTSTYRCAPRTFVGAATLNRLHQHRRLGFGL